MKKIILISVVCFCFAVNVSAQKYDRYDNYDFSDGLTSNYVDCILEDSRGFLWFGSWNGLNRFDGYNFIQYKSDFSDSTNSLTGNWIFNLFEDRQQNIWICTNNGLCRYDYNYNNFEIIKAFYGFDVKCVVQSDEDNLWISTIKGLYKYNYKLNKVLEHYSNSNKNYTLSANELSDLIIDKHQNLWIATINSGLIHFNTKTKQHVNYQVESRSNSLQSNKIRTLVFDSENRLWIGSFDNGIAILDTVNHKFVYKQFNKNEKGSIGSNGISRLLCDSKGTVWACCQNGYLNRYNQLEDNFIHYQYNLFANTSLKTKSVSCIYEDRLGNYWIGTHGSGLSCRNLYKNQFKTYTVMPNLPKSLPDNKISSFVEMDDGNVIIGTDGGGLSVFNRQEETFETYTIAHGLASDAVTNITKGRGNDLWISTWNGGIALFDYKIRKVKSFVHDNNDSSSLIFNNVKDILYNNETLWIATHGEGVALYDIKRNTFSSYLDSSLIPFDLKKPTWANSIIKDFKNRFWIATSAFLYCFDGTGLKSYMMEVNNPSTISGNQAYSIYEDSQQNIWVITDGGIDKYDETNDCFVRYSTKLNFPKNAKAIVEDNNNNVWFSMGSDLSCFNPKTDEVKRFTQADGLPNNDYIQSSAYKLADGTLLFGGTNGFVMFHPDSLFRSTNTPSVEFLNLYIDYHLQTHSEKNNVLQKAFQNTDTILLKYSSALMSIDIAGIDYSNSRSLSYKYQLQGLNNQWIDLGKERKINLPTLPPGQYYLNVKAYKSNGVSSEMKKLVIVILPAWWQTWWFRIMVVLCGIGILLIFFNYRIQQITRKNRELERVVADRTSELVVANSELKELNNTKNKLFTIIAHDLKNPMSILIGFSSMLSSNFKTITEEKKMSYIKLIADSSNNIFKQLEQLLSWAMAQSNNLNHNPQNCDIEIIVKEVTTLLSEMAQKKEIEIYTSHSLTRMAYIDAGMISTVVRNLTTNALKFTPQGGRISIVASEVDEMIIVSISDSGVGMTEEQCSKLFRVNENKTTYGTNNEKGTGLGLVICKEFVEKNGGTIAVESQLNKGTTFTFTMPLGSEFILDKQEILLQETILPSQEPESIAEVTDKPLLLVVEDVPNIAKYIKDSLQAHYEIELAPNGLVGLEKCRELLPDLIISDVSMPEMDGEQLCIAIKSDPLTNYIPLILLTARNLPEQQLEGLKKGADDYIFKPFDISILQEKIKTILKNRELYREHIKRQFICQPDSQLPASQDDKFLEAVVSLIEANLKEPHLTVEFVAKEIGISRAQLFRKFKAIVGQAPVEFIRNIKLRSAAQMLKTGNWRVSDVAYEVGFTDPQYFSKCFQKEFGVLPSMYGKGKE
ncbi:MAG: response regulator [Bacteroidales bacterium]|nr:response regulator [Bacteroidales bacterium]